MNQPTCPCGLCGRPTTMLGTKRCEGCWELERRVKRDPLLAARILAAMPDEEGLLKRVLRRGAWLTNRQASDKAALLRRVASFYGRGGRR